MKVELDRKMFNNDGRDSYGDRVYLKVRKYSNRQLNRIANLKNHIGSTVQFKRGSRYVSMILVAVTLPDKTYGVLKDRYKGYPFDFRLNYPDHETNTKRMWDGYWTNNIDRLKLIK